MLHDILMFTSNFLKLLLYKSNLRDVVYLTRFVMLSMNISRKFPNLATLNSFLSDTIFMELQILESVF